MTSNSLIYLIILPIICQWAATRLGTNAQSEMLTCYSNNCTTAYGNITACDVLPPSLYYPMPTCLVPAAIGACFVLDWPATSKRTFGCLTQRSCPFGYKCCTAINRCNCDPNFSTVLCPRNLTQIQMYPIPTQQPFVVNADYNKNYRNYVFEVWTNFTELGTNVTFTITSVSASPSPSGSVTAASLFGIHPGSAINSAKVFIDAGVDLEPYMARAPGQTTVYQATTYTLTILAQSVGFVSEISQQFRVRIEPFLNRPPRLTSPANYPALISIPEDTEYPKKLVTICANDPDNNLDAFAMCESFRYKDFYAFNDPYDRFYPDYTAVCTNITNGNYTGYTGTARTTFCFDVYTKAGAFFSVRDEQSTYQFQVTFRDQWRPPAFLNLFFNVTVVPKEDDFWRYCFVCNRTSCLMDGPGRAERCLPGQHYCCKRVLFEGSILNYQADRFCSSTKADNSVAEISCCGNDYCNISTPRNYSYSKTFVIFILLAMLIKS